MRIISNILFLIMFFSSFVANAAEIECRGSSVTHGAVTIEVNSFSQEGAVILVKSAQPSSQNQESFQSELRSSPDLLRYYFSRQNGGYKLMIHKDFTEQGGRRFYKAWTWLGSWQDAFHLKCVFTQNQ